MYSVYLIKLVSAGEKRVQRRDLEEHTSSAPKVHLRTVVTICEEAFGSTIPASGNIFCIWLFRIDASTRPEVSELQTTTKVAFILNENVLWLYISMKYALAVHMIEGSK
jgi:hypothetical protein